MSTDDELAIKVKNLSKTFKLPHEKNSTVKGALLNIFERKGYTKQTVLSNISLEVKKGEFFGVVGRNGSGKSTLLKVLAGIYPSDKGEVTINGSLVPFIELGVGFNPELTGKENVYLNGALIGLARKEMDEIYQEIVDFAELEKFMDQKLKNYSSGMQVRLAFSIAIRAKSDILLIDEVLAVGDAIFQQKCLNFFKQIKGTKTVVFISHDMRSVERFCDRVMIINNSKAVDTGLASEMVYKYGAILTDTQNDSEFTTEKNKPGTHKGTGEAVVHKVEILGEDGKTKKALNERESFKVRAHYKCKKEIKQPVFIVSIFDNEGTKIISSSTEMSKVSIDTIKKGFIDLEVIENPLAAGKYSYNVGIFGPNMIVAHDHYKDAGKFMVAGSNWGGYKVQVKNKWDLNDKS